MPDVRGSAPETERRLCQAAREAATRAYAPYSGFPVGAAVLTEDGSIFTGTNVENASYGLTNCAERSAIFSAVGAGHRRIRCVVVYTPTSTATAPCGACRQVMYEFGRDSRVLAVCDSDHRLDLTAADLLPAAFGPDNLG